MLPLPIAENRVDTLSPELVSALLIPKHFVVENTRTARRFLKSVHREIVIDDLEFLEIEKHSGVDMQTYRKWLKAGLSIGIMSEAGCPGVADPGAVLVQAAHDAGAKVLPVSGPSSLLLALMASGLNGQRFAFHGYLPVKTADRKNKMKALETLSRKEKETAIFIETPYRNVHILADLLETLQPMTRLCIAYNISGEGEWIRTKMVADWNKEKPEIGKAPVVFLLLAG